jgi:hypothetical protein
MKNIISTIAALLLLLFSINIQAQTNSMYLVAAEDTATITGFLPYNMVIAKPVKDTLIKGNTFKKISNIRFADYFGAKTFYTTYECFNDSLLIELDGKLQTIHNIKLIADSINPGILFGDSANISVQVPTRSYYDEGDGDLTTLLISADTTGKKAIAYDITKNKIDYTINKAERITRMQNQLIDKLIANIDNSKEIEVDYKMTTGDKLIAVFDGLSAFNKGVDKIYLEFAYKGDTIIDSVKNMMFTTRNYDGIKTDNRNSRVEQTMNIAETDSNYVFYTYSSIAKGLLKPTLKIDTTQAKKAGIKDEDDIMDGLDDMDGMDFLKLLGQGNNKYKIEYLVTINDTLNGKTLPRILNNGIALDFMQKDFAGGSYTFPYFPMQYPVTILGASYDFKPVYLKKGNATYGTFIDFDNAIQEYGDDEEDNKYELMADSIRFADSLAYVMSYTNNPTITNLDNKQSGTNYIEDVTAKKQNLAVKIYLNAAADIVLSVQPVDEYDYQYSPGARAITTTPVKRYNAGWHTILISAAGLEAGNGYHVKMDAVLADSSTTTVALFYEIDGGKSIKVKKHKIPKHSIKSTKKAGYLNSINCVSSTELEFIVNVPENGIMIYYFTSDNAVDVMKSVKLAQGLQTVKGDSGFGLIEGEKYTVTTMFAGKGNNLENTFDFEFKKGTTINIK